MIPGTIPFAITRETDAGRPEQVDEAAWRCLTPGQRALLQRAYAAIETFRNPDASDDEALDAAFLVLDLPQVLLDEAARVRQQSE